MEIIKINIYRHPLNGITSSLVDQDPVVQGIISLTSSLKDRLIKCLMTLQPNTLIFLLQKMRESLQKLLAFFQQKILAYFRYQRFQF